MLSLFQVIKIKLNYEVKIEEGIVQNNTIIFGEEKSN